MSLPIGSKLGPYEIVARIGSGGMGDVYRARDTRLDRTVAIKVLPSELSNDAELRGRFEREARAISSLNHPHICTVHDLGHDGSVDYLVMEHLEGETLADRIERGPLPLDQLLRYAIEIASALDCAHRSRIVHRDLKPGNVMLTDAGAKLLDFGLAKWAAAPHMIPPRGDAATAMQPKQPLTAEGTILGTIHYMAPEQLAGKEADPRTDIFAFGALLYEMATSRRAFEGDNGASVIAAILERNPPSISDTRPLVPPQLDRIVRTCLAKNPDDRFQTAHDLVLQLEWLAHDPGSLVLAPKARRRPIQWWMVAGLLAVIGAALAGWIAGRGGDGERGSGPLVVAIPPPPDAAFRFAGDDGGPAVISPDGRQIAFTAADAKGAAIWVRPLSGEAVRIAGTAGAKFPFWAPDSRSLGFFAGQTLRRVGVSGGPPLDLAPAPDGRGGSWSRNGTILYAPDTSGGLMRVNASGGTPSPVTKVDRDQHTTHRWPVFFPDGRRFLYLAANHDLTKRDLTAVFLGNLRAPGATRMVSSTSHAEVANDSILYMLGETLVAQRLDRKGNLLGVPKPVAKNVFADETTWRASFSVSQAGRLVHHPGGTSVGTELAWFDRAGRMIERLGERALVQNVRISPDGQRVAADIGDSVANLWIYDLATSLRRRLTYTAAVDMIPVWSPDGRQIAFSSNRNGSFDLYMKSADGTSEDILLLESDERTVASDWSPDGTYLVYNYREPSADIWILPLEGERKPRPLIATPFDEYTAQISPDGRWVAYSSHETGAREIFIAPLPSAGPKWQISTGGGRVPRWRADGKELFYLTPDDRMIAAELRFASDTPEVVSSKALFQSNVRPDGLSFDVTADGERFLINTLGEEGRRPLTLIFNWNAGE